jgi:hypothetical protein
MFMPKLAKIKKQLVVGLFFLFILFFSYHLFSLFTYQHLVNLGSIIADKQCLNVNPLIIQRKNTYTTAVQALMDGNSDQYLAENDKYMRISKKFVIAQEKWLNEQEAFMKRWDFQLFLPELIKKAAKYQYQSRLADVKSSKLIIKLYESIDTVNTKDLTRRIIEYSTQAAEYDRKYNRLWEMEKSHDWRTNFISIPASKCPEENLNIPDVENFLNPSVPSQGGPVS